MRDYRFRFWKDNVLMGTAELSLETKLIDVPYEWDFVEQSTGLYDADGNEIWEGDICSGIYGNTEYIGEVLFIEGTFAIRHSDLKDWWAANLNEHENRKVIGTIHDAKGEDGK